MGGQPKIRNNLDTPPLKSSKSKYILFSEDASLGINNFPHLKLLLENKTIRPMRTHSPFNGQSPQTHKTETPTA